MWLRRVELTFYTHYSSSQWEEEEEESLEERTRRTGYRHMVTKGEVMQITHHIEHPAGMMLATGRRDQKCNHLMMVMTAAQPSVSQTHHPDGLLPRMLLLTLTLTIKIVVTLKKLLS